MAEGDLEAKQSRVHQIVRSDGHQDRLTRQAFNSYDMAYEQLERYYGDLCCSDDERIEYVIVEPDSDPGPGQGA